MTHSQQKVYEKAQTYLSGANVIKLSNANKDVMTVAVLLAKIQTLVKQRAELMCHKCARAAYLTSIFSTFVFM
jgi:hypothetical protein